MAEQINIDPKIKGNKLTADEFNEVVNKTNASINELNETVGIVTGITEDINTLSGITSGHTEDINSLTENVTGITEDINTLSGITSGHTEDIIDLDERVTGITEDINTLSGITSGHTEDIIDLDERVTVLETGGTGGGGASIERVIWTSGQTEPIIAAETIIGRLEEGDTHLVAEFTEGENKVAIINNVNKLFPQYTKLKPVELPYFPEVEIPSRKQGNKITILDYESWSFLFRVNSDGSNDDSFNIIDVMDIYPDSDGDLFIEWFSVAPDNSIYTKISTNINELFNPQIYKFSRDGIRDTDFDTTKFTFDDNNALIGVFEIQSTEKIICCYNDVINNSFNIIRLNPDGSKDTSFNDITSGETQQNYPELLILQNDEIIWKSDTFELRKYNSEGIEDQEFSTNYSSLGLTVNMLFDKATVFSDNSFLTQDNDFYRINADGSLNTGYTDTLNNTISLINQWNYIEYPILTNDELIFIGNISDSEVDIELIAIKLDSNGYFTTEKTLPTLNNVQINSISDDKLLFSYMDDNENYTYSEVRNISDFSNIITTLVEKPHYALQSQLEYPIFTPNTYYLPIVLSFDYVPGAVVYDDNYGELKYYLFNSITNSFDLITYAPAITVYIWYLNSLILRNEGVSGIALADENMRSIPALSEVYDDPIITLPYLNCQFGMTIALMELNDRKVVLQAFNDQNMIEWRDAITNETISGWTYPTTGETFVIHKLTNTKVALRHMEMIDMGQSAWKISYLKYELDIETGEVIDLTPDPTTGTTVMRKYVDGISYGIFKIGDTETAESDIIIDLPNGDSIRETSYYYYGNIGYNIPFAVLSSTSDIKILSYDSYSNFIKLFDMSQNETFLTNLNNFEIAMKYCTDSTSGLFQYYDFFKTEDYYYLVFNTNVGVIYQSINAITWTLVQPSNLSIYSGGPYANICGTFGGK